MTNPFNIHAARAPLGQQVTASRLADRVALSKPAAQRAADGELHGQIKGSVDDVARIVGLPVLEPLTTEEYESFCQSLMLESAWQAGERLNQYQVAAALAWQRCPGIFGAMAVGSGKTLVLQLIASIARREGHQKICLLLPRDSIDQLLDYDIEWIRTMIPYNVEGPFSFKGLGASKRLLMAQRVQRGLFLLPYSLLSTRDDEAPDLLEVLRPTVLLADECYFLKNARTSACARRVVRFLKKHRPRFVAVAGSITSKGPDDYAHLLEAALHEGSPLPLDPQMLMAWSMVISSGAMPSGAMAAPLAPLVRWARAHYPAEDFPEEVAGFRKAFRHRLVSAPGVIATNENEIGTSLAYCNVPVEGYEQVEGWPRLKELIDQVEPPLRLTPNGDEIAHKIHAFKWLYELSNGFYNELVWPEEGALAERRKVQARDAARALAEGRNHLLHRKNYYKALRDWFDEGERKGGHGQFLDTPMMVADEMCKTGARFVGDMLFHFYSAMCAAETATMAVRDKNPHRICPFKILHVLKWCKALPKSDPGAIVWVHHTELGRWAYEIISEALGPDRVVHCPSGDQNKAALRDPANAGRICIASLPSHFHTLNLQHHGNMYFLQWSRSATFMEQGVGRVHRQKQERDHIDVYSCNTLPADMGIFSASIVDALYQHQTGGGRQKLLYGDWTPPQDAMPPEALKAMGALEGAKPLDPEHRKMLAAKFIKNRA